MEKNFIDLLITILHQLPAEAISGLLLLICFASILILLRLYGYIGVYTYNILAVITANIQVMKMGVFSFSSHPIALGTVIFSTTFLTSDLLTEHWDKKIAQRCIGLCFGAQLLVTLIMVITLGYKPLPYDTAHTAIQILFTPSLRLFIASLTAFYLSHLLDIFIFQRLSDITHKRCLWLRTAFSASLAALTDNILFSTLAWVILAPTPISLDKLIFTYILGTFISRVIISFLATPIMYLSYYCLPPLKEK